MVNKRELESQGYALARTWGGPQKVRYYRPDGGEVWKIPGYLANRDGAKYDILILKGYTFTPPENPKPHCDGCTNWHDTQEEVDACIKTHKASEASWEEKAKEQFRKTSEAGDLRKEVDELKELVKKLLEDKREQNK